MKIDRTRALMLVGLLAASGCVIPTADDDDGNNPGEEAGAPGEGGSGTGTGGTSSTGGSSAAGETSEGGAGGDGTSEGGAAGEPMPIEGGSGGEPASTGGTTGGGGATGGSGGTTGGSAPTEEGGMGGEGGAGEEPGLCSDAEGVYPGCEGITVDPSCEGLDTFQIGKCESAPFYFKPRIAEMIQYCVVDQTPLERCETELTYACIDLVIQDACPDDDEALDACATILSSCEEVAPEACLVYLSAMTETGKEQTIACMEEGLFCDLYSCVEGL